MNFKTVPIVSRYFRANEGYNSLVDTIIDNCRENDLIFISETPISTIEGNLVDESNYESGLTSFIVTELWSRYLWGYILCPLLGYDRRTVDNLRNMPAEARKHKAFILERYGFKHALQPTAEAGVDLSNVPDSYVSLLPENPAESACTIKKMIYDKSSMNVEIIIMDTDPTYRLFGTYFTTLPKSVDTIRNDTGIFGYVLRSFSRKIGVTPLASTVKMDTDELIQLANCAEQCQKDNNDNFFETVYNMGDRFGTDLDKISEDMLCSIKHVPAVIIRKE